MEGKKSTVAVAGATGRTGRLIVEELLKKGFQVKALVRSLSSASWLQQEGVEIVEVDITSVASLESSMDGAQYVISALGSKKPFNKKENNKVDNRGVQNLAKAAKAKAIRHIVVISSIGVGDSSSALSFILRVLMGPVLKVKAPSEEFVRTCDLSYTIFRPGGLKDKEISGQVAFGEGGKIVGSISRKEVAQVCVDALTNPAMKNRTLEVVDVSTVKDELRPFLITIK